MAEFTLKNLASFLVKAKIQTYAADEAEVPKEKAERPGFKELVHKEGDFEYRDSYAGFYFAPGQEIVKYKGKPVWSMVYSGGMLPKYQSLELAKKTYSFLKLALQKVEESRPFRGPSYLKQKTADGAFEYVDKSSGSIGWFKGTEKILLDGKEVYRQDYIGGLILSK